MSLFSQMPEQRIWRLRSYAWRIAISSQQPQLHKKDDCNSTFRSYVASQCKDSSMTLGLLIYLITIIFKRKTQLISLQYSHISQSFTIAEYTKKNSKWINIHVLFHLSSLSQTLEQQLLRLRNCASKIAFYLQQLNLHKKRWIAITIHLHMSWRITVWSLELCLFFILRFSYVFWTVVFFFKKKNKRYLFH